MQRMTLHKLLNFIGFQVVWLACALGAGKQIPELAVLAAIIFIMAHIYLSVDRQRDLAFIMVAGIVGTAVDSILMNLGVFSFSGRLFLPEWLVPIWLSGLWLSFASTLHYSLSWLQKRYVLATLFGAVGGPLSYYAGHRFGALTLGQDIISSLVFVSICWGIITPALARLAELRLAWPSPNRKALTL